MKQKSEQQRIEDIELYLDKIKPLLSNIENIHTVASDAINEPIKGRKQSVDPDKIELSDFKTLQTVISNIPFLLASTTDAKQPCDKEFTTKGNSLWVTKDFIEGAFAWAVGLAAQGAKLTCATGDCKKAVAIGFEDINIETKIHEDGTIRYRVSVIIRWKCQKAE